MSSQEDHLLLTEVMCALCLSQHLQQNVNNSDACRRKICLRRGGEVNGYKYGVEEPISISIYIKDYYYYYYFLLLLRTCLSSHSKSSLSINLSASCHGEMSSANNKLNLSLLPACININMYIYRCRYICACMYGWMCIFLLMARVENQLWITAEQEDNIIIISDRQSEEEKNIQNILWRKWKKRMKWRRRRRERRRKACRIPRRLKLIQAVEQKDRSEHKLKE